MRVDDLLHVVVRAVLQPDRRGVDEGDIGQVPGVPDWVAAEVEPLDHGSTRSGRARPCSGSLIYLVVLAESSSKTILIRTPGRPRRAGCCADEPGVLRDVIQVQLDDDLRQLVPPPPRRSPTYSCVVSRLNRYGDSSAVIGLPWRRQVSARLIASNSVDLPASFLPMRTLTPGGSPA